MKPFSYREFLKSAPFRKSLGVLLSSICISAYILFLPTEAFASWKYSTFENTTTDIVFWMVFLIALLSLLLLVIFPVFRWVSSPVRNWIDFVVVALTLGLFGGSILRTAWLGICEWPLGYFFTAACVLILCRVKGLCCARRRQHPLQLPSWVIPDMPIFPLTPDNDAFGRIAFIEKLAENIRAIPHNASRVVGLVGTWGTGKTTIIKNLAALLKDKDSNARVVTFDTWHFRGTGRLVEALLTAVVRELQQHYLVPSLKRLANRYAKLISPVMESRVPLAKGLFSTFDQIDDIEDMKSLLEDSLKATGDHLIVFIDDVDRLSAAELHELFKTVRLCASIPRIIYVLSYDVERVVNALGIKNSESDDGRDFLDKIIEEEIPVPMPPAGSHQAFLDQHIDSILSNIHGDLAEDFRRRMREYGTSTLCKLLKTPRHIKRLSMSVKNRLRFIPRDINPFDFVMLETIRQRFPSVYRSIRFIPEWLDSLNYSTMLAAGMHQPDAKKQEYEEKINQLISACDADGKTVKSLLTHLFPPNSHSERTGEYQRRLRRICHPKMFERYFFFDVQPDQGKESELEDLIGRINDADNDSDRESMLANYLRSIAESRWSWPLEIIGLFAPKLAPEALRPCIRALSCCSITNKTEGESNLDGIQEFIAFVAMALIGQLADDEQATATIVEAITKCSKIEFGGELLYYVDHDRHEAYGKRQPDKKRCQAAFDDRVRTEYLEPLKDVFRSSQRAFYDILAKYSDGGRIGEYLGKLLTQDTSRFVVLASRLSNVALRDDGSIARMKLDREILEKVPSTLLDAAHEHLSNVPKPKEDSIESYRIRCFLEEYPKLKSELQKPKQATEAKNTETSKSANRL